MEIVEHARRDSGRDIHLVLVGDGPELDVISQQDELPGYVHPVGFQSNVKGYFAMGDLGVLPSKFLGESYPLVAIECLQAGVPFMASELGEIASMLDSESGMAGLVVPLKDGTIDIDLWSRLLADLVVDEPRIAALKSSVTSAADKFCPEVMLDKYAAVYQACIRDRKGVSPAAKENEG